MARRKLTPAERQAKREERYARAIQLTDEGKASATTAKSVKLIRDGLILKQIAAELGLTISTIGAALLDPERVKDAERKQKRNGHCEGCGQKVFNAGSTPPRFCHRCRGRGYTKWSPELVVEKIQEWARRYGTPPASTDWNMAFARRYAAPKRLVELEQRHREHAWPGAGTVMERFGSWNAAMRAAGFKPLPPSSGRRRER